MFICIYQPIYTILFSMVHCNLCAPTEILGDLSVVGDLIVLLRQTRGDPTALPQEGVPTAFVLSMFKVRAGVLCDHCGCRGIACISTARRSRVLDIFMTPSWCDCNFRSSMKWILCTFFTNNCKFNKKSNL